MRRVGAIGLLLFSLPYYHGNALTTSGLTLKGLGVYTHSPVEFALTDPHGRRTGFDPITSTSFHEIPVSDYSHTKTCGELYGSPCSPLLPALNMANPVDGRGTLDVIGIGREDLSVEVRVSDAVGDSMSHTYTGTTAPGVRSRFTFSIPW